jgi:hypothetical protein
MTKHTHKITKEKWATAYNIDLSTHLLLVWWNCFYFLVNYNQIASPDSCYTYQYLLVKEYAATNEYKLHHIETAQHTSL